MLNDPRRRRFLVDKGEDEADRDPASRRALSPGESLTGRLCGLVKLRVFIVLFVAIDLGQDLLFLILGSSGGIAASVAPACAVTDRVKLVRSLLETQRSRNPVY